MKRLFDENDKYTKEALDFETSVIEKLKPIIDEMYEKGYSIRELEYLVSRAAEVVCLEKLI